MKIVVIGDSGRIGSQVVTRLAEHGEEAIAASPSPGVNTVAAEAAAGGGHDVALSVVGIDDTTLAPGDGAILGETRFADRLDRQLATASPR